MKTSGGAQPRDEVPSSPRIGTVTDVHLSVKCTEAISIPTVPSTAQLERPSAPASGCRGRGDRHEHPLERAGMPEVNRLPPIVSPAPTCSQNP